MECFDKTKHGLDAKHFTFNQEAADNLKHIEGESVDVVMSNAVLEHIPENRLSAIVDECYRVLRPGGYMLHQIDLRDHGWLFLDNYAFLRYSDREWCSLGSKRYAPFRTNRLRSSDFITAFSRRFTIVDAVHQKVTKQKPKGVHPDLLARYSTVAIETEGLLLVCHKM
jgi:ubiquinone/menaquinone biosynthesis C-methylase UbiE